MLLLARSARSAVEYPGPTLGLNEVEVYLMDSAFLKMWDVPRSWDLLLFLNSDTTRNLLDVFVHPFHPSIPSPKAPITAGIVVAFIPHIRWISISRSLYLGSSSVAFTKVFLSE